MASAALLATAACAAAANKLDPTFGANGISRVPVPSQALMGGRGPVIGDLAAAPGGKMVASLSDFTGGGYLGAARLRVDGSPDPSFGADGLTEARFDPARGEVQAQGVAEQRNGRIVVAGFRRNTLGHVDPVLVRFRADGALDPSFGRGGKVLSKPILAGGEVLHAVAVEAGGRIVAVGARNESGGGKAAGLVIAYRPDGSIDRSFARNGRVLFPARNGGGRYTGLRDVKTIAGGKLLISGYLAGRLFLARLTADGRLDRSFGGGDGKVLIGLGDSGGCVGDCGLESPLALEPGGQIVVGADRPLAPPVVMRIRVDGSPDVGFGRAGRVPVGHRLAQLEGLAVQGNNRIVAVGFSEGVGFEGKITLAFGTMRLFPGGAIDRGFGRDGSQTLELGNASAGFAALTQPTGRAVAAGGVQVSPEPPAYDLLLARYTQK
jgi:uncharacterized delta-60 repeat protein